MPRPRIGLAALALVLTALALPGLSAPASAVGPADGTFYDVCADVGGVLAGPSCPDLGSVIDDLTANPPSGPVVIALAPGQYCPVVIPALSTALTIYGRGADPGGAQEVSDSELSYFSTKNCPSAPATLLQANDFAARLTLLNLSFDGSGDGGTNGAAVSTTGVLGSLAVRDVTAHHLPGIGLQYSGDSATIYNSAFIDDATGLSVSGTAAVIGNTIAENHASGAQGEGIYTGGFVSMINNTVVHNDRGVDIQSSTSVRAFNNIVGGNLTDCAGTTSDWEFYNGSTSGGHNLTGATCPTRNGVTDLAYGSTSVEAPAYHGGPTPSIAAPEAAQDAGDASHCGRSSTGSDQREARSPAESCGIGSVDVNANLTHDVRAEIDLDFGTVAVGQSEGRGSVLAQLGADLVKIHDVEVTGDGFALQTQSCKHAVFTAAASQTCSAQVTFTPTQAGAASGSLDYQTSAGSVHVSLTATGADPTPSALTAPATSTVAFGAHTMLSTTLTDTGDSSPIADATVTLSATPAGGSTTTVGTVQTNGSGTASLDVAPTVTTTYTWAYAGEGLHAATTSTAGVVTVVPVPHPALEKKSVTKGTQVAVFGTVSPTDLGAKVTLQQKVGASWKAVGTDTVRKQRLPVGGRKAGFVISAPTAKKGTLTLRVSVAAANGLGAATSQELTLRVR